MQIITDRVLEIKSEDMAISIVPDAERLGWIRP